MKSICNYIILGALALTTASCSDFLDTVPNDALSPSTTWKDETDADKFLTGCYDGWETGDYLLYWDCGSDYGYNNFSWEGMRPIGDGSLSANNVGWSLYDFDHIRRVNEFLANVDNCEFSDESTREDMKAQARFIRAYRYFQMNWNYGGVPIISNYQSAEEAQVARNSEIEVKEYVESELDDLVKTINEKPAARGRIAKGAALALRMREALYYEDWATAKDRAEQIINMGQYNLDSDYSNLFNVAGQSSNEIILAVQYIENTYALYTVGQMYNNGEGGWSSMVPTYNLVDTYEMSNGMTIDEEGSGYDATHPFHNRDPRLAMSIIYPGRNYTKSGGATAIFNTLDQYIGESKNSNYYTAADNASKTGLTWAKYLDPITQYSNIWSTNCCPIVFRYAEVLLSYAEASNELNGPSDTKIYDYLDMIRTRVGMPVVDRTKYNTQEKLRELIRRERSVELAGEALRRNDILRWKDTSGKMIAETVMNGRLDRRVGTVNMDSSIPEGERATINTEASADQLLIETRKFNTYNRYLPIPQESIDASNKNLVQNSGYTKKEE